MDDIPNIFQLAIQKRSTELTLISNWAKPILMNDPSQILIEIYGKK